MKKLIIAVFAACCGLLGAADLNDFIHDGSMVRPLAGATSSAAGYFAALDCAGRSSDGALLASAFDSWSIRRSEALLKGKFDSRELSGLMLIVR